MTDAIKKLASEALSFFELKTRDNGEQFYGTKSTRPEWLLDLCREAHDDMMPDDYRYEYIYAALEMVGSYDDFDTARCEIEGDAYTHELTTWLGSNINRTAYADQARELGASDTEEQMRWGQALERTEVFDSVLASLQERADEIE